METKHIAPLDLKLDGPEGSFRARIATLNVIDKDGDVTLPGAFPEGQRVKIAQFGHNWSALPVGLGTIHSDDRTAWVSGRFFLDTQHGRDTYATVKHLGDLQEWSYGFDVVDSDRGTFAGQPVRFLRRLDVHEVSPVMVGAGIGTRTEAIKRGNRGAVGPALFAYAEVPATALPPVKHEVALGVLAMARDDLRLPGLTLRWFQKATAATGGTGAVFYKDQADILGFINVDAPTTIWLRADLDPRALVKTAAHEAQHVAHLQRYQHRKWGFDEATFAQERAWRESDSERYERRIAARLGL